MHTKIVTFTGRPGSGKSTIITNLLALLPDMRMFEGRSFTTRPRRTGDVQGEYQHVSENEFLALERSTAFIWSRFKDGFWYGTKKKDVEFALQAPYVSIMTLFPDTLPVLHRFAGSERVRSFFIVPPDEQVLVRRIVEDRGAENLVRAQERLGGTVDWRPDMDVLHDVPLTVVENPDENPPAKSATEFIVKSLTE